MLGKVFNKAKELGSKGLHEAQRKTAVDVLNKTQNKVSGKSKDVLDKARVLVVNKYKDGGGVGDDKYVAVHVSKDGYWTIASKPTYKGMAVLFKGSEPKNETFKVVTLEEALNHKKVVGREYLMKTGGAVGEFERLPNSTKSNELYVTYNNFKSMYDSLMNGDDFDKKRFQGIINELTHIKNKAKKFKSPDEIKGTEYMENGGGVKKMKKGARLDTSWVGNKTKENWGKHDLYEMYSNNLDLCADLHDYFKQLLEDSDEYYTNEMKNNLIEVLKTGNLKGRNGKENLKFAQGGATKGFNYSIGGL